MALNCSGCDAVLMNVNYGKVCKERDELKAAYEAAQLGLKALNERMVFFSNQRDEAKGEVQKMIDRLHGVASERDMLAQRVVQLEAEKALLIDFAKKSCEACEICRHVDTVASEKCEGICGECALASCCICAKCYGASEFEFAGVGEGNG